MTGIDRDVLITRVLDGEATPEDWSAFRAMAARDQSVWAEMTESQQDRADLAAGLAEAIAVADSVEAPVHRHAGERLNARLRAGVAWLGWAAAAALALGAVFAPPKGGAEGLSTAGLFPVRSAEDAMQLYLDKGQESGVVLGELPDRVLLSSTPSPDGRGYTVVFLRQLVERRQVDSLYQLGQNEAGQPVVVPVASPRGAF